MKQLFKSKTIYGIILDMKKGIHYDKQTDALYIALREGKEDRFEEIEPNIVVEYNKIGKPIGIEILNASSVLKNKINAGSIAQ